MEEQAKKYISLVTAVVMAGTAIFQYIGKEESKSENALLIEQQNKLIDRYEKEAERNLAVITFLDSIARKCTE